jgi:hypothetical protein
MPRRPNNAWILVVVLAASLASMVARAGEAQKADPNIDFAHDIMPLLKARCAECHTNGKYKASLSMDTRADLLKAKVVLPGKSGTSELLRRITSSDPEVRMPPKGPPLSAKEVTLIKNWIDQGLAWEPNFSFKISNYLAPLKPRRPPLPVAKAGREHPVDRLLDAYFAAHKILPPPETDDVTFIRRLFLDGIGLLPTPAEVDGFLADPAADKRTRLAARVLADRRAYAEHWLTFWNDLLRNDYAGTGYIDGGRKQISPWLYRSLLDNKPYDQFVRELISPTPESEGFVLGIKWRGNVNASQVREVQFSQNVAQVFFGINLKCASCHDSFIDRWKLADAYGLAAVIAEKPLEIHRCDKATGRFAVPRFMWPELGTIDAREPKSKRLEQLAQLVTHEDNGRFTRTIVNRVWARLMGRGLVQPVDGMGNRPWSEDVLDYLATYLSDNRYDLKKLVEHIVTSRTYQARAALAEKETTGQDYLFRGPEMKRMTAEQFLDTLWQITGTAPAKAAAPVALPAFDAGVPAERRFIRAALVNADALMRSLGRPNREQVVTARPEVLTTLQALDLSNGQILADYLVRGAANVLKANAKATSEQLADTLYRQALCRLPNAEERSTARDILGTTPTVDSVADLLWCIVMLPEYQLVR